MESMKIAAGSSFKTKTCDVCGEDAFIIVFEKEEGLYLCVDHYEERGRNADNNENI